jgi:Cof subfamily protein (haloacid dehalogenase superfamily)
MDIRLIALDLDGTTMNSANSLSANNKQTIEAAIDAGVEVVVASGRAFDSIAPEVLAIRGLRYAISSNGAHITDRTKPGFIYSNYIDPTTVDAAIALAKKENLMLEAFWDGKPFIGQNLYDDICINGSVYRNKQYVMSTRNPVDNLLDFMQQHRTELENINFFFYDDARREEMMPVLYRLPDCHVTSSVKNNIEIGGLNSTKAHALKVLSTQLGIPREQIMSFGDAGNDISMIEYAGFGVAVGNAWDDVKAAADYISETNDEDGVAKTIRKFVL